MKAFDREELERRAYFIRRNIIHTIATNGEGHAGGALSAADAMAVLFFGVMELPGGDCMKRDKFLLSAGHKCLALYGALTEAGLADAGELKTYNGLDTVFPGHPDASKLSAVDFSTGSLGHGLPLGCGYALAAKRLRMGYRTFVLMGDGEQGEGSNWEAAAFAAHNRLDNLVAILDENTLQINGRTCEVCMPASFEQRYAAFNWDVQSVDGHDVEALYDAFSKAESVKGRPSIIIMKTVKGKGLSFLENDVRYHHWNPGPEQAQRAVEEIDACGRQRGWLQ